jgi:hypothetical protein
MYGMLGAAFDAHAEKAIAATASTTGFFTLGP